MMFSKSIKNAGAGIALAAALALGSGGAAFAHECYNPSRSDQGDAMAGAKSPVWETLVVSVLVQGDVDGGYLTQEQADCILGEWAASGGPESFTVMVKGATGQNGVIAANNPNDALAMNGKGIDHIGAAYGEQLGGIYVGCGVHI